MTRLCFGTFAQVLRLCKRDGVTDNELIGSMTRAIDTDCQYSDPTNKTSVSRLFSCEGNLSSGRKTGGSGVYTAPGESLSKVKLLAPNADRVEVINKFAENVVVLIDEDKKEHAVLALLEIIRNDIELDGSKKKSFEKYAGMTKDALLSQSVFGLADFFAGLFLYAVIAVKNTVGKECVKTLTHEYIGGFSDISWLVSVTDRTSATQVPFQTSAVVAAGIDSKANTQTLSTTKTETPNFAAYLRSVKSKYSIMKTLLYNEQPKSFYGFYVCNDIERRVYTNGKYSKSYKTFIISNVTVTSLLDCSRFTILAGTGGLGKSMMMRHLLLNAAANYEEYQIIPVFIPLKDFDETVDNLFEYIYAKFANHCADVTEDDFKAALSKGKCLLLFDGLDEIGSTNAKRFERELENFIDKFSNNAFVISSRPYQSFISYSRFTLLQLRPFSKEQALMLIDKLDFRIDEPIIKEKFRTELNDNLYRTHRTFTENPLLLTIMLLTFEQYAEVPSKMHLFYREAFSALSVKHDASKGAYKRTLKTGLTADRFADYFAEICSRSYYDEKFEMTEDEFADYYNNLKERKREKDSGNMTEAGDYLYDLCSNMCLMYFESGKYHFTHRSFQEYFCALYFSKQKDKNLENIGDFFEHRHSRMYGDKTFNMLYDMISDKVDEYIFLPFLTRLFDKCDNGEGYWTFLEDMYPCIYYEKGETNAYATNDPRSYLYDFIKELNCDCSVSLENFPHYDDLVTAEYAYVIDEDDENALVNFDEIDSDYKYKYGTPDIVGWCFEFDIVDVRGRPKHYDELLRLLNNDGFALKKEYAAVREYYDTLKAKQKPTGSSLFDLF